LRNQKIKTPLPSFLPSSSILFFLTFPFLVIHFKTKVGVTDAQVVGKKRKTEVEKEKEGG